MSLRLLLTLLLLLLTIRESQSICTVNYPSDQSYFCDLSQKQLMEKVAPAFNTTYLSIYQQEIKTQYQGIIFGWCWRALINLPLSFNYAECPITINAIFKIDTGAAVTTLTRQVLQKLLATCPKIIKSISTGKYFIKIAGHPIEIYQSQIQGQNLNIIGADYLTQTKAKVQINYKTKNPKLKIQSYQK